MSDIFVARQPIFDAQQRMVAYELLYRGSAEADTADGVSALGRSSSIIVDAVLGIIVVLSSVFIISNTVRLTILSRRSSIEILKLVGATNRFITTPFIIEGAFQGGLASIVSLGFLAIIFVLIRKMLPDLGFLPPEKIALYITTCILIGSLGSYAALRRFLRL